MKEYMVGHKEIDPMLTVSDVARLLSVHINTVRRWSNQEILKAYRVGSRGDRRFQREDVASFLSEESKIAEVRKR
jgi:excisionase family DNA binding protein